MRRITLHSDDLLNIGIDRESLEISDDEKTTECLIEAFQVYLNKEIIPMFRKTSLSVKNMDVSELIAKNEGIETYEYFEFDVEYDNDDFKQTLIDFVKRLHIKNKNAPWLLPLEARDLLETVNEINENNQDTIIDLINHIFNPTESMNDSVYFDKFGAYYNEPLNALIV